MGTRIAGMSGESFPELPDLAAAIAPSVSEWELSRSGAPEQKEVMAAEGTSIRMDQPA